MAQQATKQTKEKNEGNAPTQRTQESSRQNEQSNRGMTRRDQSNPGMTRRDQSNRDLTRRNQNPISSPFTFMRRFTEEMDRLFDDFAFGRPASSGSGHGFGQMTSWSPQTEIFQRGKELVLRVDLPGLTKDQVNVELEEDQLIIQGERRDERETNEEGFYQSERSYGSFYRSIPLPPGVDGDQAKADFNNGVLEITMPMPEQQSSRRRIEIGEGGKTQSKTAGK